MYQMVKNTGELPQHFAWDHHDPIVRRKYNFQVQGEIMRRKKQKDPTKERKAEEKAKLLRTETHREAAEE